MIQTIRLLLRSWRGARAIRRWERAGRPVPPPHALKQRVIVEHARRAGARTLIETGTYQGDMVEAMRSHFARVHSIEVSPQLCRAAQERFRAFPHVTIHEGDSGALLKSLLSGIQEPCLFWLDGHYSAGVTGKAGLNTPVLQELDAILAHPTSGHVVLIDDAHEFTGRDDYPTLDELRAHVQRIRPSWEFSVGDNIVRIHQSR